jgi:hypothetical protein
VRSKLPKIARKNCKTKGGNWTLEIEKGGKIFIPIEMCV